MDAGPELRGRVHRRHDRQASSKNHGGFQIEIGRVQEKRGSRRTVSIGVRSSRMASVSLHAALSSSGRRLSASDRSLLHSRWISSEFIARRGNQFDRQFTLQAATIASHSRVPATRSVLHGEVAAASDRRWISDRHRYIRHSRLRQPLRLLLHPQIVGGPSTASEYRSGFRSQSAAGEISRESTSAFRATDIGYGVARKQSGADVAELAPDNRL